MQSVLNDTVISCRGLNTERVQPNGADTVTQCLHSDMGTAAEYDAEPSATNTDELSSSLQTSSVWSCCVGILCVFKLFNLQQTESDHSRSKSHCDRQTRVAFHQVPQRLWELHA